MARSAYETRLTGQTGTKACRSWRYRNFNFLNMSSMPSQLIRIERYHAGGQPLRGVTWYWPGDQCPTSNFLPLPPIYTVVSYLYVVTLLRQPGPDPRSPPAPSVVVAYDPTWMYTTGPIAITSSYMALLVNNEPIVLIKLWHGTATVGLF